MTRSTRQIERDVERTRSDIEETVEALRDKMSLGQIVDEAAHYFRGSGGNEMVSNLTAQARANPMALALVGIGLTWLMSGRGQPATVAGVGTSYGEGSALRGAGARAGETAASAKARVADASRRTGEAVSSRVHQAGDALSSRVHQASDAAADTYGRMSDEAARIGGQAQRTVSGIVEDEPLILAGLGLAVGAAIGAMLPPTETENRLLGEKRDRLMQGAEDMAREEWQKAKSVAKDTAAAVQAEVEKGGPPAKTAERAAKSAARTAQQSASDKGLGSSARKG
jgi:hypothetical protein